MGAAAARRAPASRRARGRAIRGPAGIRWDRVARASLLVVLLVIVASYIGPAAGYIEAWRLSNETRAEVEQLRSENERLRQRARKLATPAAEEREARRAGMARPGERVYVVRGLPGEKNSGP